MSASNFFSNPWVVAVVAPLAVAVITAPFKRGRQFWLRVWAAARGKPFVPTETLRFVQDVEQSWWSLGKYLDRPNMQVNFQGYVTNLSDKPNNVLRLDLPKPVRHSDAPALLLSRNQVVRMNAQTLAPFENAGFIAHFFVEPLAAKPGQPWKTTLIFIDRYNNPHKVKNCVFRGLMPPSQSAS